MCGFQEKNKMSPYVVLFAGEDSGDLETIPGLVRRVNLAYDYIPGYPRVKFNNLVKSRKLDFIFSLRKTRKINTEDVLNIIKIFEPKASPGSYNALSADIELLTGDKVLYKYDKGAKLIDDNAEEFIDNVIKDLAFEGYNIEI